MKKFTLLSLIVLLFSLGGHAQYSGTYTIDSTMATGGTNFISFSDFADSIAENGISGAVTVNVAAGVYNDQLSLEEISGSSMTNTITIDGAGAATISHDKSIRNSTITIERTSWITITGMTIEATGGTDSWGIHILDSAHHVTIDDNIINLSIATTADKAGVLISNSETSDATSGNNGFDIVISNNTIRGGERGITVYGSTTVSDRNENVEITNNTITQADDYGIYVNGYDGVTVNNNHVDSLNNSGSDALYLTNIENFEVKENFLKGRDNGFDADDLNFEASVTLRSEISNNMIIGLDDGLYLDDIDSIDIFHNSTYGDDYGIYLDDPTDLDIRNNIFYGETDEAFYSLDSVEIVLDYNIYFSNATGDKLRLGTFYADLAEFQADVPTLNVNSLEGNPFYVNELNDLHNVGTLANDVGDNSVGITVDIDGDTRPLAPSTTVDIGADEYDAPSCLNVTGITSTALNGGTSALVTWIESGSATEWEVEYGAPGYTPGTGTSANVMTDTFYTITGLMGLTDYDVYVRTVCGVGDESIWKQGPFFTTSCAPYSPTYLESFDTFVPECWTEAGAGDPATGQTSIGSADWTGGDFGNVASNGRGAKINLYFNNDEEWLLSPIIDLSSGGPYELTINAAVTDWNNSGSDNMGSDDTVQVVISSDSGKTWTVIQTWDVNNQPSTTGDFYIIDLTAYSGAESQFAIWATDGTVDDLEDYDFHVDEFNITTIPTCRNVRSVQVSDISTDTANVNWIQGDAETQWEVEWDFAGYTPGDGANSLIVNTDTFTTITGLLGGRKYDIYVRAICGMGDSSLWEQGPTFYTFPVTAQGVSCTVGNPFVIFSEEFEEVGGWTGDINSGNDSWEIPGDPGSSNTGPDDEFSGAPGSFMNFEASNTSSSQGSIVSPAIDLSATGTGNAELSFWMHAYGADMGELQVGVGTSPTGPFTTEFFWRGQIQTSGTDDWINASFDLSGYIGQTIYIEFLQIDDGSSFEGDMSIDLVEVTTCESCESPTNLVASDVKNITAQGNWTAGRIESIWEVEWDTAGFTAGMARNSMVVMDDTFALFTGLSPVTDYDFYVRSICNPGVDTSTWSMVGSFTTSACIPVTDIMSNPADVTAEVSWTDIGGAAEWIVEYGAPDFSLGSGTRVFVSDTFYIINGLRVNTEYDFYVRAICNPGDSSVWSDTMSFTTFACVDPTALMATTSSNLANLSWTENGFATEWQVDWDTAGTGAGAGNKFITNDNTDNLITGLRAESTYEYYVRAICGPMDTSAWSAVGTINTLECDSVTDLMSDVYGVVADLWWTENGTAIEWEVEYGVTDFTLGTGTSVVVTDTATILSDLMENTDYDWYVRAICGPGDTSAWSDTAYFRSLSFTASCEYNLVLEDAGGNGWQGNTLDVTIGGSTTNYTLASGSSQTITLSVNSGDTVTLDYLRGGIFTTEVSFTLLDADNSPIYASGTNPATGVNYEDSVRCPSCVNPTALTVSGISVDTAFVNWTEEGSATEWIIEWDLEGFMPGTGANSMVTSNTNDTITGLGSFTFYDIYVRAICAPGDTSAYSFVTNFESDFVCPVNAICAGADPGDISTDYDFRTTDDRSACAETIVISIPAGNRLDSLSVTYDMTSDPFNFPWISEQRSWLYSPISDRGEDTVAVGVGDVSGTFTYERTGLHFANKLIGDIPIELHAGRALNFGPLGCETTHIRVDDGTWNLIAYFSARPSCSEPLFPTTREVGHDTAKVSWIDIDGAPEFEIEWGLAGFTAGMGANSMIFGADTFATITGLTGFSDYDYYIRAICGATDTSEWSERGSFTTLCGDASSGLSSSGTTDVTADVNWIENGVSTQWIVEWDLAGFTAGTGANSMVVNTDTFTTLTGLSASSDYDFYVRPICAVADTGVYSTVGSFTTLCGIPAGLNVTDVATDTAVANWTETGIATEWEIEWDVPGFTPGSGANNATVTNTSATMDNLSPSEDYEFYVRAICGVGDESEWSLVGSFTSACGPAPTNLNTPIFFDISDVTANIRWEENAKASDWIVEYDVASFMPGSGANSVVTVDTFTTLTGLMPSTNYNYYVRSICGAGDTSAYSVAGSFKTLCGIPSGLSATAGSNQAEISWTETGSATQWEIQYGAPGFVAGTGSSVVADANPFTITGLSVSTDYEFYVRAICGIGDASLFSSVGSFTTGECDSVTNLVSADVSVDTVNLSWTENGTAISWEVSYGATGFTAGMGTQVSADTNNGFTLRGLDPDTDYDWYVRAVCNVGENSPWSDTASFTTPLCFEPTNLSSANESLDTVDLSWTENGSAMEWEIEYGATDFMVGTGTKVVATTNPYTLSGLDPGTDYDWYVRAICNADDTSAWSDTASFTTMDCVTPTDLKTSNIAADTADISWTAGGNAVEWEIEYGLSGFTLGTGMTAVVTTNSYTLTGLGVGLEYEWYVRAICSVDDTSDWSFGEDFYSDPLYYAIGTINTSDADGVADSLDVYCWTSGIVAGVNLRPGDLEFTIIDVSSGSQEGIKVFSFDPVSNYQVTEGDSIRVRGLIDQFRGLTQIRPDSISIISTGIDLPRPMLVDSLGEYTESKLIDLYDLVMVDGSGSGSYNMRAVADKGNGDTLTIRVDFDTDVNDSLDINPLVAGDTICRLVGIGGQFDSNSPFTEGYQVFPMRFSDIDTSSCINIPVGIDTETEEEFTFNVTPNPTNGEFTLKTSGFNNSNVQVIIRDMNGRILIDETIINANNSFQKAFNLSGNAKGLYFINILDGEEVINEKLILQ